MRFTWEAMRDAFYRAALVRFYAVADDKKCPPGSFFGGSGPLVADGNPDTAKNLIGTISMPFGDSVSGRKHVKVFYGRTTPVGAYTSAPMGSLLLYVAAADGDADIYIKKATAWTPLLTGVLPKASSTATTALAGTRWDGMRIVSEVPTGVTCAGEYTGLYIETAITGTGICSGVHYGLKIETYVTASTTLAEHYGAAIYTYSDIAGTKAIQVLRLEHNGASVGTAFLGLYNSTGKIEYLITSAMTNELWMSIGTTPTCSNVGGWYRVKHGGYTRYIQLWTTVS